MSPPLLSSTLHVTPLPFPLRRRRLKPPLPPSSNLLHSLVSSLPSIHSLDLLVPALALSATAAFYLHSSSKPPPVADSDNVAVNGSWILFSSPTAFNRSVLLRCPSLAFEDGLDGVSDRLVEEEAHFVRLRDGAIPAGGEGGCREVVYQRVCVGTGDGGVVALDWPDNLELRKEHGLDTTVLLVPGTTGGSGDEDVKAFVCEVLRYGCFPVVMNPRGCAGSPVTTPRLFTAADSDDICTAIQFIKQSRPWTTLMSVGWGCGANMLTKYLSEKGDQTSITAAICINNPFDLGEATKSYPHRVSLDQKLTGGLIDILRRNKEIFQGKTKEFSVARALEATCLRDFEEAISMISYGFENIDDFYSSSSSKQLVGNVKIPILFIQSDDGMVPLFSIPRNSIAENQFTSLLLCSCLPSNSSTSERAAFVWFQHLAIEWLQAVELAILKGRHPLLEDVDIPLNLFNGFSLIGRGSSAKNTSSQSHVNGRYLSNGLPHSNIEDSLTSTVQQSKNAKHGMESGHNTIQTEVGDGAYQSQEANVADDAGNKESSSDSENKQALATAAVLLNMLEATMPQSLDVEQKRKVLDAVDQGETLMKALQGAVPEDVRGKLGSALSDIIQTQGTILNLDGLMKLGRDSNIMSKIQERLKPISKAGDGTLQIQQKNVADNEKQDGSANADPVIRSAKGESGDSASSQENIAPISGVGESGTKVEDKPPETNLNIEKHDGLANTGPVTRSATDESDVGTGSQEKSGPTVEVAQTGMKVEAKLSEANLTEEGNLVREQFHEQEKVNEYHESSSKPDESQIKIEDAKDISNGIQEKREAESSESVSISTSDSENSSASQASSHDPPLQKAKKDSDEKRNINGDVRIDQDDNSAKPEPPPPQSSSINVSEALDAFNSFDDSTQMAVNSVFGVIENMIDQYEKETEKDGKEENNDENKKPSTEKSSIGDNWVDKTENDQGGLSLESDAIKLSKTFLNKVEGHDTLQEDHKNKRDLKENATSDTSSTIKERYDTSPQANISTSHPIDHAIIRGRGNDAFRLSTKAYWQSSYSAHLRRYFSSWLSNMKSVDSKSTTDLFLDTEKGQWKIPGQVVDDKYSVEESGVHKSSILGDSEKAFEPSHVILLNEQPKSGCNSNSKPETVSSCRGYFVNDRKDELLSLIKNSILDALNVEVNRRLGTPDMNSRGPQLASDIEKVAEAVSFSVISDGQLSLMLDNEDSSMKFGTIEGHFIIDAISSALENAEQLRNILPIGVIVGSCLASLRDYFDISNTQHEMTVNVDMKDLQQRISMDDLHKSADKLYRTEGTLGIGGSSSDVMVGALTSAPSALLAYQQKDNIQESYDRILTGSTSNSEDTSKGRDKLQGSQQDNDNNNLVNTIAEKAKSVAAPIVPTKKDGEFDEERLVSILTELGQKGGLLRFFGNVALLWGGLRGAMSLADRLIRLLQIAERPLFQRILGFICIVLVLWSPVAIPLLPRILQRWTSNTSAGIVGYACIAGLDVATLIVVMLWGKRIRGYERPLEQYGLSFSSISKVRDLLIGLTGGIILVLSVHSVNALLGFAIFTRSAILPPSSVSATLLVKAYVKLALLFIKGITVASCIAIMEELLFRSWLPDEISVDLGHQWAIIISGLTLSLLQRSLSSIPGFLFLSLALFGAKLRDNGSLFIPIGARAGIMLASFMIQNIGLVVYKSNIPLWLTSRHSWHPFDGIVGLCFCVLLALVLYPKKSLLADGKQDSRAKTS